MATKTSKMLTEKKDAAMDKKSGIKENSPRDLKADKKANVAPPRKASALFSPAKKTPAKKSGGSGPYD